MSYSATRRKRFTAGVLAGAMAMTVMPILGFTGTAGALEEATGDGSVCEDAPNAEPFTDVTDADPSQAEIECLVNTGITTGVTATTYEPNSPVTRRQMALFLVRLADVIEENAVAGEITPLPDGDGVTTFTDVGDEAAEIQAAIDRLADSGIAEGVTTTEFMPASFVTRRQMAKFIVRLQEFMAGEESTPDDAPNAFTDDEGDSGEAELDILAAEGVFLGDGAGNVNPGDDISRRQMANVIIRKAQYHFEQGDITRLFPEDDTNQAFTAAPAAAQFADTSGIAQQSRVTFSGLDVTETYDVTVLPCGGDDSDGDESSAVFADGAPFIGPDGMANLDGVISFYDEDVDDEADHLGFTQEGDVVIRDIDGDTVNSTYEDEVSPRPNGTIEVDLIGAADESDCAIALVFEDHNDDDALDLGDENAATLENDDTPIADEPFAVSAPVVFHEGAAVATSDPSSGELIVFMGDAALFGDLLDPRHDVGVVLEDEDGAGSVYGLSFADDRFYYQGDELDGGPIAAAQVMAVLTVGDELEMCDSDSECNGIDNTYQPASATHWMLFDDDTDSVPARATNVMTTVGDFDGDGTADDVKVDWTAPSFGSGPGGHIDSYDVEIWNNVTATMVSTSSTAEANALNSPSAAATTLTVLNVGQGNFRARVAPVTEAEDDTQLFSAFSEAFAVLPDDVAPTMTNADLTVDGGTAAEIDSGDTFVLDFSENLVYTDNTGVFRITDPDGEIFEFDCTLAGVSCTLGDDGAPATVANTMDRLTVALTVDPVKVGGPAGDGLAQVPSDVTQMSTEFDDGAGNDVDLAGSADVTIDNEF